MKNCTLILLAFGSLGLSLAACSSDDSGGGSPGGSGGSGATGSGGMAGMAGMAGGAGTGGASGSGGGGTGGAGGGAPGGKMDMSFGDKGWAVIDFDKNEDVAYGLAILSDNSILLGGEAKAADVGIAKLTPTGMPDSAFGTAGKRNLDWDSGGSQGARALFVDSADRLVLPAWQYDQLAAVRAKTDGTADTTFGKAGIAITTDQSQTQSSRSGAIDSKGRVAVVGQYNFSLAVALFDENGAPVTTFDSDGLVATDFPPATEAMGEEVLFQKDGKLVVAGFVVGNTTNSSLLARYNTDGTLDTSFGASGGYTVGTYAQLHEFQALAEAPDGKFLLAGHASGSGGVGYVVSRHNADGKIDTSFGSGGYIFNAGMSAASDIAVAPDGTFYVSGQLSAFGGASDDFAVAKHKPDGSLDASFATAGIGVFPSGRNYGMAWRVDFHGSDHIVLAGAIRDKGELSDYAAIRVTR